MSIGFLYVVPVQRASPEETLWIVAALAAAAVLIGVVYLIKR